MISTLDWQGHRGCRGLLPENTIPSFLHALDQGASTLEMDVVITGDGKVLISHEHYFCATISTPPDGIQLSKDNEKSFNLFQMSYDHITQWDVGLKSHPEFKDQKKIKVCKPLLADAIDAVECYIADQKLAPVNYSIEIKSFAESEDIYHPSPKEFALKVLDVVQSKKISTRTVIQSFDSRIIREIKKIDAEMKCSFLYQEDKKGLYQTFESLEVLPDIFGPEYSLVDQKLIDYCHDKCIKIIPWTINDLETIKEFITMGIDGIITDFPNWIDELSGYLSHNNIIVAPVQ